MIWLTVNFKHPVVYFGYEPHRDGTAASSLYAGFHETLLCNGYAADNMLALTITRAGCWSVSTQ
ncbi:hypothetical protein CJP55_04055 [Lactobacillus plantarum]|nr:hypothetical protein [Lactiplantibacillus plantarum]